MSTLNALRTQFINTLETVYSYTGDVGYFNSLPFISATYEYFRKCHLEFVTDSTAKEEAQLRQKLPTVYSKLGKETGLLYRIDSLKQKDDLDYARDANFSSTMLANSFRMALRKPKTLTNLLKVLIQRNICWTWVAPMQCITNISKNRCLSTKACHITISGERQLNLFMML
uniref:AAA-ATPase_like domain-containing protein n=1 Tax=Panagrellus redivivus TaxID=6233 RepID=A0A7E4V3G9_PANRE